MPPTVTIPGCTAGTDQAHPPKALRVDGTPALYMGNGPAAAGLAVFDYTQPAGAQAATMSRLTANTVQSALVSGTPAVMALSAPAGVPVTALTMVSGTTAKLGGSHGWYVLLDQNMNVIAVTADQVDAATVWGVAKTFYTLPVTAPVITPYTGLYYIGACVVASTMPTFYGSPALFGSGMNNQAPPLCGTAGSALTAPPAVGSQIAALTPAAGYQFYAYTS